MFFILIVATNNDIFLGLNLIGKDWVKKELRINNY